MSGRGYSEDDFGTGPVGRVYDEDDDDGQAANLGKIPRSPRLRPDPDPCEFRHIDVLGGDLTDAQVVQWYLQHQPPDSGPHTVTRKLCIALEEVARLRGLTLPPAKIT